MSILNSCLSVVSLIKDNSPTKPFFIDNTKGKQGYEQIMIRFDTLIKANCERPFDWYKKLGIDQSDASKIRRGLMIPPRWLRISIAQHFKTDSANMWTVDDLPHIRSIIKKQERKKVCE